MEGWFKVFIGGEDGDAFLASVHAQRGCVGCHGGVEGVWEKDEAHVGLRVDPSEGPANSCNDFCHAGAGNYARAVHTTQAGYLNLFQRRAGLDLTAHPELASGFAADCASCHASCGDCHVSQPKNVGGGLIAGHRFNRTPDMTRNCTACHGSRVGDEYRGLNDYAGADVHYRPGAMTCVSCHTGAEMHGDATSPAHRYEVASMPRCIDCHADVAEANVYHLTHFDDMSCQVCHSQTYKGCNSCHVGQGITGTSMPIFKIGRNPIPQLRDAEYVLLRHVPLSPDTFEGWGLPDLAFFESEPTWKYASPHNIRRWTERTQVEEGLQCFEACHNSPDGPEGWFLRASDLQALPEAERAANADLIVPDGSPFTW